MTLNSLEVTKCCKKIILFLFFVFKFFNILYFIFLELFLDEHAMVLQYMHIEWTSSLSYMSCCLISRTFHEVRI